MKTHSIMLQTLAVPCNCRCRYCLLSWNGRPVGWDYEQSEKYAGEFYDWITKAHPDISFNFSFGYSMDHPQLIRAVDFMNSIGSVTGRFLQMNGFGFRSPEDSKKLMADLYRHGVQSVNFTFYGTEEYHDAFAGRNGDFRHLLIMADAAVKTGISASAGIALTSENHKQMRELCSILGSIGFSNMRLFIPHEEGKGVLIGNIRCSLEEYDSLDADVGKMLDRNIYRTESEWMSATDIAQDTKRSLIISLTPDNIELFRKIGFEETVRYVERLDDEYYRTLPEFRDLLLIYGDVSGEKLYGKRDIYQHYQKIYLADNKINIYDVTDERYCGSRRYR